MFRRRQHAVAWERENESREEQRGVHSLGKIKTRRRARAETAEFHRREDERAARLRAPASGSAAKHRCAPKKAVYPRETFSEIDPPSRLRKRELRTRSSDRRNIAGGRGPAAGLRGWGRKERGKNGQIGRGNERAGKTGHAACLRIYVKRCK
ncbi:hypothetical protein MTO96_006938 [Rhipicephalus appendiculatus]